MLGRFRDLDHGQCELQRRRRRRQRQHTPRSSHYSHRRGGRLHLAGPRTEWWPDDPGASGRPPNNLLYPPRRPCAATEQAEQAEQPRLHTNQAGRGYNVPPASSALRSSSHPRVPHPLHHAGRWLVDTHLHPSPPDPPPPTSACSSSSPPAADRGTYFRSMCRCRAATRHNAQWETRRHHPTSPRSCRRMLRIQRGLHPSPAASGAV